MADTLHSRRMKASEAVNAHKAIGGSVSLEKKATHGTSNSGQDHEHDSDHSVDEATPTYAAVKSLLKHDHDG